MVSGERLDKIERELEQVTPRSGPHEPPDDPSPEELSEWYQKALENPEVEYWDAYFRMIEEVEKLKDAGVIPTAGPRAGVTDIEDGADDAQADSAVDEDETPDGGGPVLPDAVADRLDGDTIAALPADVADDLPPEKVDEAAHLLQEIAEQKREGEPT